MRLLTAKQWWWHPPNDSPLYKNRLKYGSRRAMSRITRSVVVPQGWTQQFHRCSRQVRLLFFRDVANAPVIEYTTILIRFVSLPLTNMIHVTQKRGQKCTRFTQFCEHYRIRPQFSEAQKEETKSALTPFGPKQYFGRRKWGWHCNRYQWSAKREQPVPMIHLKFEITIDMINGWWISTVALYPINEWQHNLCWGQLLISVVLSSMSYLLTSFGANCFPTQSLANMFVSRLYSDDIFSLLPNFSIQVLLYQKK